MGAQSKSKKQPITVKQIGLASLILAIVGGIIGYYNAGVESAAIGFAEWFIAGFVILYIVASFIELLRK